LGGALAIVVLQAYFWINLREMNRRTQNSILDVDAVWIALYPSAIAKAAVFVSVLVLPVLATGLLYWRGMVFAWTDIFLIIAVVASVLLSILVFRELPKLSPQKKA
jgi:hypothetical protein